jgi:hypothetical protein
MINTVASTRDTNLLAQRLEQFTIFSDRIFINAPLTNAVIDGLTDS